jgi:hypothetical protein
MLSPAATIVGRDLSIKTDRDVSGDETFTLTVNGADTALSCKVLDSSPATGCQDTTHAVTIPASSTIAIHYTVVGSSGGGPDGVVRFGWRATTP